MTAATERAAPATHVQIPYQPALDGIRAVAVLAVIAYHLGWSTAPGGFLGVDAFFVLSGFLITSLLLTELVRSERINLPGFWSRRARRLLPALLLVLLVVAIYGAVGMAHDELQQLRGDGLASLFYVANWRFIASGQSYFALFSAPSPLRHVWSLAIEEQFYLVWPLIVLLCIRAGRGSRRVLGAVCVAGIVASVVEMALLYNAADPSRSYYGTDTRAHELLVGALLAILFAWRQPRSRRSLVATNAIGILGAAVIAYAFVVVKDTGSAYYHGGSLLFACAVAAVIAASTRATSPLRTMLSPAPLRWIGRISYGLYLWHWPMQVMLTSSRVGLDGLPLDAIRIAASFGAATLSFYLVERPIRHGGILRGRLPLVVLPTSFAATGLAFLLATTAAAPVPGFLNANGKVYSPGPTSGTAPAPVPQTGVAQGLPPGHPRLLLLGDSVAASLQSGLTRAAAAQGLPLGTKAIPGCGLLQGTPTFDGKPWVGAPLCNRDVPKFDADALDHFHPDLVLWLSTWETADQTVDGHVLTFGSPELDQLMLDEIEAHVRTFSRTGAGVVFLTLPSRAPNDQEAVTADETRRVAHLDSLFEQVAARDPTHVSVVDLASIVCPTGPPCPKTVDGVALRPRDGWHFGDDGAAWVAQRLVLELLACRPAPTVWKCPAPPVSTWVSRPTGQTSAARGP